MILQYGVGDCHAIACNRLEELREAWSGRQDKRVLLMSDCLEGPVADLIVNTAAPFIIFADDPVNMLIHMRKERGLDAIGALRVTSQCISSMADLYAAKTAHIIGSEQYGRRLSDFVTDLMAALYIPFDPDVLDSIMYQIVADKSRIATTTLYEELLIRWPYLGRPDGRTDDIVGIDLAPDFTAQYGSLMRGAMPDLIEWPKALFLTVTGASPETAIDLVGPARHLTYGPYMHLPRGRWIARVEIEVAENRSGNSILADVVHKEVVAIVSAVLPSHGVYEFDIAFTVVEALMPVEIRISMLAGAIEGKFILRSVRMFPDHSSGEFLPESNGAADHLQIAAPV